MDQRLLGVRLTGGSIKPGSIRSKEIAELIEAYEDMIVSVVIHENPELQKETIVVGLTGITDESIGFLFTPNVQNLTIPAARKVYNTFATLNFNILPPSAIKSANKIISFVKKHNCEAELTEIKENQRKVLAVITPSITIPSIPALTGETTLYGEITRVGGIEPKVQFKTVDGQTIYCEVSHELAKKLGRDLYSQVALRGVARWNTYTLELEDFTIEELLDYQETSLTEAFSQLHQAAGDSFEQIDDVPQFVTRLRRGEL